MAANLAGMFTQLNNAIQANPMGKQHDNTVAGMTARPQDKFNPFIQGAAQGMTGMMGGDTSKMATSQQAKLAAEQRIAQLDLSTTTGLKQAAQIYSSLGMNDAALELHNRAAIQNAKEVTALEESGEAVTKEAQRKRGMAMAMKDKDRPAYEAIKAGILDPAEYIGEGRAEKSTIAKEERAEQRKIAGEARGVSDYEKKKGIDEKYEDSSSPAGKWADDKGYERGSQEHKDAMDAYMSAEAASKKTAAKSAAQSVAMQNEQVETQANERMASGRASSALSLARELDANPFGGGLPNSVRTAFSDITGFRGKRENLITAGTGLITSNAIRNLPVGPASDKDVALVLKGEPPMNADSATLASYARGVAKLAAADREYYRAKDRYMSRHGDVQKFGDTWELKTLKERKGNTPASELQNVADKPETLPDFIEYYGYDPRTVDSEIADLEAYLNE